MQIVGVLLSLLLPFASFAIDSDGPLPNPELQARYDRLTDELRCLVCQNQTVADSNADLAKDLRARTREMLLAGASDAEILEFMTDRYGDFVLYRPPVAGRTVLLWAAPILLLLIGSASAFLVIRGRSQAGELPEEGEDPFNSHGTDRHV
ncbi:MAG: cytochrome c-type biogenesis protein CcmH [Gammaproteobacteria bacterium]|nr:MAG: cytochrome c-type biogenesis protein CcmH [Gammaproteobacteria bacterium]